MYVCVREKSVTSRNLSRIKFKPRGPDSRQSFREWYEALECHLTALTLATADLVRRPLDPPQERTQVPPPSGLSSLLLLVPAAGQAPRDQHRAAPYRAVRAAARLAHTRRAHSNEYLTTRRGASRLVFSLEDERKVRGPGRRLQRSGLYRG